MGKELSITSSRKRSGAAICPGTSPRCGAELSARSDDQDENAINKRHDIYYNTTDGTLAAAYFFKKLADEGKTKYIELNGEGSIDSIKETLLSKLS